MIARRSPEVLVGTSGWMYQHWRGTFYPADLPQREYLEHYAERLDSLELNTSFYHLPRRETFADWRRRTPAAFRYSVKANRFITHNKKLKDPAEPLQRFFAAADALGGKLACVLYQLPPMFSVNVERLRSFLRALPRRHRATFEFRNHSWFCAEVYGALAEHNAALCLHDLRGFQAPLEVTADFVYVRLHGPVEAYRGSYSTQALRTWAERCQAWMSDGRDVMVYFDNDEKAFAVGDAVTLDLLLRGERPAADVPAKRRDRRSVRSSGASRSTRRGREGDAARTKS
jgi:uncharacterized protein YecE (DUF72 family)